VLWRRAIVKKPDSGHRRKYNGFEINSVPHSHALELAMLEQVFWAEVIIGQEH
jgi:hypothetical protein